MESTLTELETQPDPAATNPNKVNMSNCLDNFTISNSNAEFIKLYLIIRKMTWKKLFGFPVAINLDIKALAGI